MLLAQSVAITDIVHGNEAKKQPQQQLLRRKLLLKKRKKKHVSHNNVQKRRLRGHKLKLGKLNVVQNRLHVKHNTNSNRHHYVHNKRHKQQYMSLNKGRKNLLRNPNHNYSNRFMIMNSKIIAYASVQQKKVGIKAVSINLTVIPKKCVIADAPISGATRKQL